MPSFQNPDGGFFNEATGVPVKVVVPVTGATVAMTAADRALFINPAGSIATLTIKLPNVTAGQIVCFGFGQAVTGTLTVQSASGGATVGAPATAVAHSVFAMCFINATIGWTLWT